MGRLHELLLTPIPRDWLILALRLVWGVVLGAATGSYLGCVAWRLPRRLPLTPSSACPACGAKVPLVRAIPVISFLLQRGRAVCCGARLPRRYLALEIGAVALFAAVSVAVGLVALFALTVAALAVPALVSQVRAARPEPSE